MIFFKVECPVGGVTSSSWTRKKRQSWTYDPTTSNVQMHRDGWNYTKSTGMEENHKGTVKKGTISGVFTIVDRLPEDSGGIEGTQGSKADAVGTYVRG